MNIERARNVLFLLIVSALLSCASGKGHLDLARASSKPGLDLQNSRFGILPLRSYPADIGSVISVVIGNELKDTGIEITETAEMIRILKEQNITPRSMTQSSDYRMIGKVCHVDYILVGKAIITTLSEKFVRTGVAVADFQETTAEIVDTTSGEVVLRATVERPPKRKWHNAEIIGEALAAAIKKELKGFKQP
ncbi:MAG: hypothetical protein JSU80_08890 [Deltaproteobacteria bacterium]|nr:MAG: hypothetical protein JSU80_08890 [Deltaproteobacteria bacterium]